MLTWMVYVVTVSTFLCGAALAAEYQARLRRTATRWIWIGVIAASLLVPTVIASVSVQLAGIFDLSVSPRVVAIRDVTTTRLSPASWLASDSVHQATVRHLEAGDPRMLTIALGLLVLMPWQRKSARPMSALPTGTTRRRYRSPRTFWLQTRAIT
jgi:hypothetical protein